MSDFDDPFEFLRRAVDDNEPTEEHVAGARRRLQHAIDIEVASKHRGRRVRVIGVAAIVAVVSLLGLAVFLRASPAEAALGAIAEAARTATAAEIPDGSFFYTRSTSIELGIRPGAEFGSDREYVAYLLPSERKVWQSAIGDFIQIEVRVDRPIFFDSADEVAYYSIGLDEMDSVGRSRTEQFTNTSDTVAAAEWPTEPAELMGALADRATTAGAATSQQILSMAAGVLREPTISSALRGALVEVVAGLPVELIDDGERSVSVAVDDPGPPRSRHMITLGRSGELLAEITTLLEPDTALGIPAGTNVLEVLVEESRLVTDLESP